MKNTNNEAINIPTAKAKKNKMVEGVLPTNEEDDGANPPPPPSTGEELELSKELVEDIRSTGVNGYEKSVIRFPDRDY